MRNKFRFLLAGAVFAMLGVAPVGATANAASLQGNWSGSGYVQPSQSARERARCHVRYQKVGKTSYRAIARCATPSVAGITQTAALREIKKNHFAGKFYNAQYNVSGRIYVVLRGSKQSMSLRSANGRARLNLRKR